MVIRGIMIRQENPFLMDKADRRDAVTVFGVEDGRIATERETKSKTSVITTAGQVIPMRTTVRKKDPST
jgi:hypothetical protein